MFFKSISINKFIKQYLKNNPTAKEAVIRTAIQQALKDYRNGVKCDCGMDIWVIGSALTDLTCYTCLIGTTNSEEDFEIEGATFKAHSFQEQSDIDREITPDEFVGGYFDDDGNRLNVDLIKKPSLCLSCVHNDDPSQEILCNLNRLDQQGEEEFICHAYKQKK